MGLLTRIRCGHFGLLEEEVDAFRLFLLTHEDSVEATGLLDGFQHLVVEQVAVGRVVVALVLHEEVTNGSFSGITIMPSSHR